MFKQSECKLCVLLVLVATAFAKPPSGGPWTTSTGKASVFSRSLGPPAFNSIPIPYVPKPSMFPKFVDPKTMIAKKTDMLNNLFSGTSPYIIGALPIEGSSSVESFGNAKTASSTNSIPYKRGLLGPFGALGSPFSGMNPMGFGPFATFGPGYGFPSPKIPYTSASQTPAGSNSGFDTFRRKRSIDEPTANSGNKDLGPPPPYPGLSPIAEEQEDIFNSLPSSKRMSKTFLTAPFSPFAPVVDPTMFMNKKATFLDTMFKNLATSSAMHPTTDTPVPKSTIVPPSFWYPTAIIPGPTEYTDKVSNFLDKLFENLKLNVTSAQSDMNNSKYNFARDLSSDPESQKMMTRSVDDFTKIAAVKDAIVNSILSELSDLKGDMMATLDDLLSFQKTFAGAPTSSKKPFKPFGTGPWTKPTVDPALPFKQRMLLIGQVFDLLTDLQRNITNAVQEGMNAKIDKTSQMDTFYAPDAGFNINETLLEAIKNKLSSQSLSDQSLTPFTSKFSRTIPQSTSSFWVAYPEKSSGTNTKRQVETDSWDSFSSNYEDDRNSKSRHKRAADTFEGYQNFPIENSKFWTSEELENNRKWDNWKEYVNRQYNGRRHYHNHH